MTRRYIADFTPGEQIEDQAFLVKSKDLRTTSNGSLYIHAVIADRSGEMLARAWQATESMYNAIPEGGFVRFKGFTESYKGNMQFIIGAIRPVEPADVDLGDFLPQTQHDIPAMEKRLLEILEQELTDANVKALVGEFTGDAELMARFRRAPAAFGLHHAYIGGLLEHTLQLIELALRILPLYPKLNKDLVLAGLLFHDIGKTEELRYDASLGYTDRGQLLGHIAIATMLLEQKADDLAARTGMPFPTELRWALQHIVLSHHGQYEFGSPKLPALPEAVAVHYIDNLDAKVNMFVSEIEQDRDATSHWTNYSRVLETKVYKVDVLGTRNGDG